MRRISVTVDGEVFDLSDQGAQDMSRYDFVKDIWRVETFVAEGRADSGSALALTNDPTYWKSDYREDVATQPSASRKDGSSEVRQRGVRERALARSAAAKRRSS